MKQGQQKSNPFLKKEDKKELTLMLQIDNFVSQMESVKDTIVLYDTYASQADKSLVNLHTFAMMMVDPSVAVKVTNKKVKKRDRDNFSYSVVEEGANNIQKLYFGNSSEKKVDFQKVGIYRQKNGSLRVIVLPISDSFIQNEKAERFSSEIQSSFKSKKAKIKEDGLINDDKEKAEGQVTAWYNNEKKLFAEKQNHLYFNILQVEVLLRNMMKLTENVSLACLAEAGNKDSKKVQALLTEHFMVPKGMIPQTIVHSHYEGEEDKELQSESVSTVLAVNQQQELIKQKMNFKERKFFWDLSRPRSSEEFKVRLFENLTRSKMQNQSVLDFIHNLTTTWREVAIDAFGIFGHFISRSLERIGHSSNQDYSSLPQIMRDYKVESLNLLEKNTLEPYMVEGRQRKPFQALLLSQDKQSEYQERNPLIPKTIEHLSFVFCFEKISRNFFKEYNEKSQICQRNEEIMMSEWSRFIKDILSLCLNFTSTFQTSPAQIQRIYNFLNFLVQSSQTISSITGRDFGLNSSLRTKLEKMQPKQDIAFKHIRDNETEIKRDEQINYYNILLAVIRENSDNKQLKGELKYIQCHILELKAYCIATNHIEDEKQIVEAIKSYAHICLKFPSFNSQQRKLICIMEIEKKMARLLRIVWLEDIAIEIYFKNRMLSVAHQTCSVARKNFFGDDKARKLMVWGSMFEGEFDYETAMKYYQDAYECAQSVELQRQAVGKKDTCNQSRRKEEPVEKTRSHKKFANSESSILEFTSQTDLSNLYLQLRNQLIWDEEEEAAKFKPEEDVEEPEDLPMLSSIIR